MKYLCLVYGEEKTLTALSPRDDPIRRSGQLVLRGSLSGTESSVAIRPRGGKPTVTDGPFFEARQQAGGFFIIEARDLNEAIRVASKHPAARLGEQAGWGIEIRPIGACE